MDAVAGAEEKASVTMVDIEIGWPNAPSGRHGSIAVWTWNAAGPDRRSYSPTATIRS